MEPHLILRADPLDILFENRNKSYGAYPLRKFYAQRLYLSLGITMMLVIISIFLYLHFQTMPLTIRQFNIPEIIIEPFDSHLKEKVILPPARPSTPKPPAMVEVRTPVITPDLQVLKPLASVDEINKSVIGLTTTPGSADPGEPQNTGNSTAGSSAAAMDSADGKPEIYKWSEVMPEFPGGIEALKRYLLKNLHMPDTNLEPGEQIRVVARFVVGADGKVSDIEITHPADVSYNTEVKRVISKMPDWKPGMQNHRQVAVYFSLPVNFVNGE